MGGQYVGMHGPNGLKFVISTLIDNGLNYDLRPARPAILLPIGRTGPPKDEIYAQFHRGTRRSDYHP